MFIHTVTINGITNFLEVTPDGNYHRKIMPSEITVEDKVTEEIEISTSAIEKALSEIKEREELQDLYKYIVYLERLAGNRMNKETRCPIC